MKSCLVKMEDRSHSRRNMYSKPYFRYLGEGRERGS